MIQIISQDIASASQSIMIIMIVKKKPLLLVVSVRRPLLDFIFLTFAFQLAECGTNAHHKCYKKMAHTCGVNDVLLAAALDEIGKLPSEEVRCLT